jgi:hypothetical protein
MPCCAKAQGICSVDIDFSFSFWREYSSEQASTTKHAPYDRLLILYLTLLHLKGTIGYHSADWRQSCRKRSSDSHVASIFIIGSLIFVFQHDCQHHSKNAEIIALYIKHIESAIKQPSTILARSQSKSHQLQIRQR